MHTDQRGINPGRERNRELPAACHVKVHTRLGHPPGNRLVQQRLGGIIELRGRPHPGKLAGERGNGALGG